MPSCTDVGITGPTRLWEKAIKEKKWPDPIIHLPTIFPSCHFLCLSAHISFVLEKKPWFANGYPAVGWRPFLIFMNWLYTHVVWLSYFATCTDCPYVMLYWVMLAWWFSYFPFYCVSWCLIWANDVFSFLFLYATLYNALLFLIEIILYTSIDYASCCKTDHFNTSLLLILFLIIPLIIFRIAYNV